MKKVSILGSTGSIGTASLAIISQFPERFKVVGLAAGRNIERLREQIYLFHPEVVSVNGKQRADTLRALVASLPQSVEVLFDEQGMHAVATHPEADLVIAAMVGSQGPGSHHGRRAIGKSRGFGQ
jgi:1-deoxy-D-xylulose-5-phosphate reductoisomerase